MLFDNKFDDSVLSNVGNIEISENTQFSEDHSVMSWHDCCSPCTCADRGC